MKKTNNPLYNKEIGSRLELLMGTLDDAYEELREMKIVVKRSEGKDMLHWSGIKIDAAKGQFTFVISCWYSYYATTGIPLCFSIEDYEDDMHRQVVQSLKLLIDKEPSLCEYRELNRQPVCGIKAERLEELCRNGTLADYFLTLVKKLGYSIKLK